MIVRWPGRVAPGGVSDLPWYFPDVMPTLTELAGATDTAPKDIDGISVVPTLLGDKAAKSSSDGISMAFLAEHGFIK